MFPHQRSLTDAKELRGGAPAGLRRDHPGRAAAVPDPGAWPGPGGAGRPTTSSPGSCTEIPGHLIEWRRDATAAASVARRGAAGPAAGGPLAGQPAGARAVAGGQGDPRRVRPGHGAVRRRAAATTPRRRSTSAASTASSTWCCATPRSRSCRARFPAAAPAAAAPAAARVRVVPGPGARGPPAPWPPSAEPPPGWAFPPGWVARWLGLPPAGVARPAGAAGSAGLPEPAERRGIRIPRWLRARCDRRGGAARVRRVGAPQSTSRPDVARWRPAPAPEEPADGDDRDGQHGGERHREEAVGDPLRRADGQRRLRRTGPVEHEPADQRAHQIGEHRNGEDHPAGPGPDGQRRDHRPGLHEEPEQETWRAPGHHGGDGADGRAGDDDADPEAALQRAPPARARRSPGVPPPAGLARVRRSCRVLAGWGSSGWAGIRRVGGPSAAARPVAPRPLRPAATRPVRPAGAAPAGGTAVPAGLTSARSGVPRAGRPAAGLTPGRPAGPGGDRAGAVCPGQPGRPAARERGRAAWLQARRRTACSGVFRAIVGRS